MEQMAQRMTERMQKELKLTDAQAKEVYNLNFQQIKEMQAMREKMREARKAEAEKMKSILTTEQFMQWSQMQQQQQEAEAQQQQQLQQMQNEAKQQELMLQEAQMDLQRYQIDQDNQTKIAVAQINAYRGTEDMDQNDNGVPDVAELGKQALE